MRQQVRLTHLDLTNPKELPLSDCPRCFGPLDLPGTSRTTLPRSTRICGRCCTDEAARDAVGMAPVPPHEWPVVELFTWATTR